MKSRQACAGDTWTWMVGTVRIVLSEPCTHCQAINSDFMWTSAISCTALWRLTLVAPAGVTRARASYIILVNILYIIIHNIS